MKEFEAKVVIVCLIIGAILLALSPIFAEEKVENNKNIVRVEE